MRNTMMFMSVAAVAACFAYRPVVAAEVQSATAVAAVAPAAAQPAATNVVHKRALKPIAKRLVAHIDLSSQTMSVEVDGQSQYSWKISSGAANGYQTPTGVYTPTHTTLLHRSRKYDNAPMPHAVFFRSGFAVHATGATWALGRPASHGCVRLAPGNARTFYSLVNEYGKSATQTARPAGLLVAPQPRLQRAVVQLDAVHHRNAYRQLQRGQPHAHDAPWQQDHPHLVVGRGAGAAPHHSSEQKPTAAFREEGGRRRLMLASGED